MLDDTLKDEIQQAYRRVLDARSLSARQGQKLMIAEIARTLGSIERDDQGERRSDEHVCVLEAGTGTGKTLAYLLSALPIAKARGKRLIVSTATVALQEQVLHHDLPMLKAQSGLSFDYALAKGRGRYLCLSRLEQVLDGSDVSPTFSLFEQTLSEQSEDLGTLAQEMADAYGSGAWEGDRDSWHDAVRDAHWRQLTTDHRQCTNRRCGHFSACAFFKARGRVESADIIVANHDLVLADLALGGGMVLPAPKDCIYVFDEAHHLPDKALEHFHQRLPLQGAMRWIAQLKKSLTELNTALGRQPVIGRLLTAMPEQLSAIEPHLTEALQLGMQLMPEPSGAEHERPRYRFANGQIPDGMRAIAQALVVPFAGLARALESITDILRETLDPDKSTGLEREQAEEWLPLIALLHGRALDAHGLWTAFAAVDDITNAPPQARWLQALPSFNGGEPELVYAASPVSAAETLARHLWGRCFGAVLTSATLTALGRFERLQERAGLANRYRYRQLPSPFDYSRAVLSVPPGAVDPSNADGHLQAIINFVKASAEKEAMLVLFSSKRQLQAVEDALRSEDPARWQSRLLCQGQLARHEILTRHSEQIDAGQGSVLFGLASFAEGIDLPGDYLTHVVITRLPFAVPDDPVDATLAEWIEAQGGNPFMRITVPDTSIRLVQACGRLIRKESDRGRITILDRRVLTKRYGRALLDSLPPFRRE